MTSYRYSFYCFYYIIKPETRKAGITLKMKIKQKRCSHTNSTFTLTLNLTAGSERLDCPFCLCSGAHSVHSFQLPLSWEKLMRPLAEVNIMLLFSEVKFKVALINVSPYFSAWKRFLTVIPCPCGYTSHWWMTVFDAVLSEGWRSQMSSQCLFLWPHFVNITYLKHFFKSLLSLNYPCPSFCWIFCLADKNTINKVKKVKKVKVNIWSTEFFPPFFHTILSFSELELFISFYLFYFVAISCEPFIYYVFIYPVQHFGPLWFLCA